MNTIPMPKKEKVIWMVFQMANYIEIS